jgi:hypothetical protein
MSTMNPSSTQYVHQERPFNQQYSPKLGHTPPMAVKWLLPRILEQSIPNSVCVARMEHREQLFPHTDTVVSMLLVTDENSIQEWQCVWNIYRRLPGAQDGCHGYVWKEEEQKFKQHLSTYARFWVWLDDVLTARQKVKKLKMASSTLRDARSYEIRLQN